MKKSIFIAFLLSSVLIMPCSADQTVPDMLQPAEAGWLDNELPVADTDNLKSKNGFGAQLWLTSDDSIYETWDTPEIPKIKTTKTAVRNQPIFAIFLFTNPGMDNQSQADITADVTIISPDGEIYGEFKDMEIWQREYFFAANTLQLAVGNLGILIEDADQLGVYQVKARIKDRIKNIYLDLQTEFTAQEN
ncbi:MAG: hypothetical protein V1747_01265 [Candidatus Omnitrophota bacterium]